MIQGFIVFCLYNISSCLHSLTISFLLFYFIRTQPFFLVLLKDFKFLQKKKKKKQTNNRGQNTKYYKCLIYVQYLQFICKAVDRSFNYLDYLKRFFSNQVPKTHLCNAMYAQPWGSRYYIIFFRDSIEVDKFEKGDTLQ